MERLLKRHFGYEQFREGQREVIESISSGKDTLAIFPTGRGKSLCYELPAYLLQSRVLIISPLLSLMEDQVAQIKKRGERRVVAINSMLSWQEKKHALQTLETYRYIFCSPEMLHQDGMRERLKQLSFGLIAIDEAHCISEWGYDFRPDYLSLHDSLNWPGRPPLLALTATANEKVERDIVHVLPMKTPNVYRYSMNRKEIDYRVVSLDDENARREWILNRVKETAGPGILYVPSRKRADEWAYELRTCNVRAESYHAGKENDERMLVQAQFTEGSIEWVCATSAFGMGIHKSDIRQVVHERMPLDLSQYVQEVGRAGRDGEPSVATLLYVPGDEELAAYIALSDLPTPSQIERWFSRSPDERLDEPLSEAAERTLAHYATYLTKDQIIQQYREIADYKKEALQQVVRFVTTDRCLRAFQLEAFGERPMSQQNRCCSSCFEERWMEREAETLPFQFVTWEERLDYLFHKS